VSNRVPFLRSAHGSPLRRAPESRDIHSWRVFPSDSRASAARAARIDWELASLCLVTLLRPSGEAMDLAAI